MSEAVAKTSISIYGGIGLLVCLLAASAQAQTPVWSPDRNVELVVPTAAGSTMDQLARLIQGILQNRRLIETPIIVEVKPGGGGAIAWTYVSRKAGDGHVLAISGPTLLSQEAMNIGGLSYRDVTPIAQLFTEYTAFAVNTDGPIKSAADLVGSIRSARSPSVGIAPGSGSSSHLALLKLARAAGVKPATLSIVPFKGANESVLALMGGHIDVAIGTMAVLVPMAEAGKLRILAVAAPGRLSGSLSSIPTWRELGFDVVEGNWRGIVAPKELGKAEVEFWSGRLAQMVESKEWQASLGQNHWDADFKDSAASRQFLEVQLAEMRATLAAVNQGK